MTKISVYYVLRLKGTDKLFEIRNTSHLPFEDRFIGGFEDCTIFTTKEAALEHIGAYERWENRQLKDKAEILKIEKTESYRILFTFF